MVVWAASHTTFLYPPTSPSRIFLWGLLACIAGVAAAPHLHFQLPFLVVSVCGSLALLGRGRFRVACIILVGFIIGLWRYGTTITPNPLSSLFGRTMEVQGVVTAEVDRRVDAQRLTVQLTDPQARILVTVPLYPVIRYGDAVSGRCVIRQPGAIEDFHYDRYLALFGIDAYCTARAVTIIGHKHASPILSSIYDFKQIVLGQINRLLPEPEASFAAGLLIGVRRSIPEELQIAFNRTGTTHIIAISGYNISLIATLVQTALMPVLGRKRSFWLVVGALILFVILTGASPSVVRAAVMGTIVLIAKRLGRQSRITNVLALAAVAMVMVNPLVLRDDAGFQLSFLATIGLVYLSPRLERWTDWVPSHFGLRENLTATIASTLMTLPLIIVTFGRLSMVAVIVNLLVLPCIPLAMALVFIMVVSSIWQPLGVLVSWAAWATLHYVVMVIRWFGALHWSSLDLPSFPWWATLLLAVLLIGAVASQLEIVKPARRGFRYDKV